MRKITIGINWQGEFSMDDTIEQAKVADDSGVHQINVAEAWGRDAFTTLALLAYETHNIQLGTSIVNTFSRTPAALAQHFTSLDSVSNGRMVIGLGASGPQVIEHFHGVPFTRTATRLREYIEIINMLVAGEPLNHEGKIFTMQRGFTLRDYANPVRRHIPIFVGAYGPRSMRIITELADGWLPGRVLREQWPQHVSNFKELVREAGRDPESVEIAAPGGTHVTDDPDAAYEGSRQQLAFYIARMGDLHYDDVVRGGMGEMADAVRVAWRDGGSAAGYEAVPLDVVRDLSYAGPVEGAIEWMEEQRDAGYTRHSISVDEQEPKKRADIFRKLAG